MNKTIKMVSVLLMVAMILVTLSTGVKADTVTVNSVITGMENGSAAPAEITKAGGTIANIISTVGIVAAVIILSILGIKYMIGSASEKAEYKKTMIPYIIGAVLLFGASAIVGALASIKIV